MDTSEHSFGSSPQKRIKIISFLLVGTLSVFFTEVFAGSSPLWFIDSWGIFMVFPLYSMHLIFFLNVAFRIKRTSLGHLYLLGVLIGLYESWITKVLWAGYPGAEAPLMGTFLGIAILEFSVLVFFWHPISRPWRREQIQERRVLLWPLEAFRWTAERLQRH